MDSIILTTKNTNKSARNRGMVCGIIIAVIGVFLLVPCIALMEYEDGPTAGSILLLILAMLALLDGTVSAIWRYYTSTSYVDVFEDHMEGKGIQNMSVHDLYIKNTQIRNVTVSEMELHIHSDVGDFKILTDKQTATEIFRYYHNNMAQ